MKFPLFLFSAAVLPCSLLVANPEAFEVDVDQVNELPKGKEADGIIGDFVMRNERIEALVSCDAPLRRANMSTFYGEQGITPGDLYDLGVRGAENDQLTIFAPLKQQGAVSSVRILKDGSDGEAVIETRISGPTGRGLARTHEYVLKDDWRGVLIRSTVRNEGVEERTVELEDKWGPYSGSGETFGVRWGDAVDPADHAGYAFAWIPAEGEVPAAKDLILAPGAEISVARFVAVGASPAEAVGWVAAILGETGTISGRVTEQGDRGIGGAGILVQAEGDSAPVPAYTDAEGRFSFRLPPGRFELRFVQSGRAAVDRQIEVAGGTETNADVMLEPAAGIALEIVGEGGESLPCKVQFLALGDTPKAELGPPNRAHGCKDQYQSETGRFTVTLAPGRYRVIVTHGIEFAHYAQEIEIAAGSTVPLRATLKRLVSTPGWVSTDYHNHSTQSGDNTCGTDDRIINLAAENIEFAPTTEHNRLYDWRPHIERLGLAAQIQTVSGMELTGGGAHLNGFPFKPVPHTQDNGAPVWQKDPRLNAIVLRDYQGQESDRWVHVNHPDMAEDFVDRNGDGQPDGGFLHFGSLIDALETQNFVGNDILAGQPMRVGKALGPQGRVQYIREFIWLQLLNQGLPVWAIAVSDAHSVHGNGAGGWRTYVKSSTDAPAEINWREMSRNSKAGHMILSNGPYLEVSTGDGAIAGDMIRRPGGVSLKVKVQCTDWIDVDRVQVLVNGVQRPELNFTRAANPDAFQDGTVRFEREIAVPLSEDSHLIVVAYGENSNLSIGYGSSNQAGMRPCAYNNPIFVDVDGGGFSPNGDTLGYPLPVKSLNPDQVQALLERGQPNAPAPETEP